MKHTKPTPKRRAHNSTLPAPTTKLRGKSRIKRSRMKANAAKRRERFRKTFGPPGFVAFVKSLACVGCGAGGSEVHHEPPRSRGGRWVDTSPLCPTCHTRRHATSAAAFWKSIDKDYGQANRDTQAKWLARDSA